MLEVASKQDLNANEQNMLKNVKSIVQNFKAKNPSTTVSFADDVQCKQMIEKAHSKELSKAFDKAPRGMFKSDICRLAQLYLHGGHYFDNDIEITKTPTNFFAKCTSFSSVVAKNNASIFQAYLAAAPGHPLIMLAMDRLLEAEAHRGDGTGPKKVGPATLYGAIEEFSKMKVDDPNLPSTGIHLFRENLGTRRDSLGNCHAEILDQATGEQAFFSRAWPNADSGKLHQVYGDLTCKQLTEMPHEQRVKLSETYNNRHHLFGEGHPDINSQALKLYAGTRGH